jgi:transcriptional regulator with XRE-family HTH domain
MAKPPPPYDGLGAALRLLRKERGWTLRQAGQKSGINIANLSRYETGDVYPTFAVLTRVLIAYGTDLHGLAHALESKTSG